MLAVEIIVLGSAASVLRHKSKPPPQRWSYRSIRTSPPAAFGQQRSPPASTTVRRDDIYSGTLDPVKNVLSATSCGHPMGRGVLTCASTVTLEFAVLAWILEPDMAIVWITAVLETTKRA